MTFNKKRVTMMGTTVAMVAAGLIFFGTEKASANVEKEETVAKTEIEEIEEIEIDDTVVEDIEEVAKEEVAATTESKKTTSTKSTKTVINHSATQEEELDVQATVKVVTTENSSEAVAPEATTEALREEAAEEAEAKKAAAEKEAAEAEAKAIEEAMAKAEAAAKAESEMSDAANEIAQTPSLMEEEHQHYEEQRGKYTYVYCSDVEEPYREGNVAYFPYDYLG